MTRMLSKPTFSIHKKNRRILIVYVVAFLILVSLSGSKIIFSYYSTIKTAQVSIANQSIEMAKSIADSLDKQTYKRFLANPIRNEEYWRIREYLNDARNQIGALYVYTLAIDNPKIAKGMIIGLPRDYPNEDDFPIGEPCTVPEKEVQLAYQGKTYFTEILTDPKYGNYLSVGAPIKEDNGNIIGYIGIDISTKMLNDIGNKVIKDSITTFIFDLVFILVLLIAFFLFQKWYQREMKKVVGETERTYLEEFRSIINSLKSTRHDFVNHLHVLHGLIEFKHYEKALEYMKSLIKEVKLVDLSLKLTNPALLILFHTKWEIAQTKQIDMEFEVSPDSFDRIQSIDIIKLFSNLIDNAVEATMELPVEQRKIKVVCKKIFNIYHFEVMNSGNPIPQKDLKKIFLSGFTTKASEDKSRGNGLAIVQEIVNRYSGEIQVETKKQTTLFRILIPS